MIASPGDVARERNAVTQVLAKWNAAHSQARGIVLLPVAWETHSNPEMGESPQAILNKQILKDVDLLVGIFWTRLGTPTQGYGSGTVEEIEEHTASGKPAMIYFSRQPVELGSVDQDQYERLLAFKKQCESRGLFSEYNDLAEFNDKFSQQLQIKLNRHEYFVGKDRAEDTEVSVAIPASARSWKISDEASQLLIAAAQDDGHIMHIRHLGGTDVEAGGRNFTEDASPRVVALWEAALEELRREQLIEDQLGKGEVYSVTHKGYQAVEELD